MPLKDQPLWTNAFFYSFLYIHDADKRLFRRGLPGHIRISHLSETIAAAPPWAILITKPWMRCCRRHRRRGYCWLIYEAPLLLFSCRLSMWILQFPSIGFVYPPLTSLIPFSLSFFFLSLASTNSTLPRVPSEENEIYPEVENQASSTVGQQ